TSSRAFYFHCEIKRVDGHRAIDVAKWKIGVVRSVLRGGATGSDGADDRVLSARRALKQGRDPVSAGEVFLALVRRAGRHQCNRETIAERSRSCRGHDEASQPHFGGTSRRRHALVAGAGPQNATAREPSSEQPAWRVVVIETRNQPSADFAHPKSRNGE